MNDIPRIISALDYISEDKLARADKPRKRKPKALFYSLGGAAAAAVAAGVLLLQSGGQSVRGNNSTGSIVISPASEGNSGLVIPEGENQLLIDFDTLPFNYVKDDTVQKFDDDLLNVMDSEMVMAYDVSEIIRNNPWNESLEIIALPVFRQKYGSDQVCVLDDAALPEGCSLEDSSNKTAILNAFLYLAEKYSDKLIYKDFILDEYQCYSSKGVPDYTVRLRKYSDNPFEAIMYYNFTSIHFYQSDKEIALQQCNLLDDFTAVGFYPIITAKDAREKLLSGDYITTVFPEYIPNGVTEDRIKHTELVYRSNKDRYSLPYYRFLVELDNPKTVTMADGLIAYGAYYVPALSSECLLTSSASSVEEWLKQPHKQPIEGFTITDYTGKYRVIPANHGAKVMAIEDGEVIFADYDHKNLGGFTVVIKHSGGIYTLYHHLDKDLGFEVEVGDAVKAGQCIGYVGSSGNIEGYGLGFRCTDEDPNL
ncbi:MAG: M23 family metallopeptidase [Oscillospiraceae bacterium]